MKKLLLFILPVVIALASARADVTLPALISDNMVLQHPQAAVWGKADPGEQVTVKIAGTVATATADGEGHWRVKLDGLKPGFVGSMTVAGNNTLTIQNVAVGDVWVGSGQSNMDMPIGPSPAGIWKPLQSVLNAEQETAAANFPNIRMFTVPWKGSETTFNDVESNQWGQGKWEVCTPATVPLWSAVGYFFSQKLHQDLGLPIGFIRSCMGGTTCQTWTPTEVLQGDPDFKEHYYIPRQEAIRDYPQLKEKYDKELLPAWTAASESAKAAGQPIPPKPNQPAPAGATHCPSTLYNGMIAGLTKYPIKGVVWYQGETDRVDASRYRRMLPQMIGAWRKAWGQGDFPFYIVQVANYGEQYPYPTSSGFAEVREAHRETALKVPNSGLAVTIDIGQAKDIHAANKQEVERRLALVAEAKTYGKEIVYSGPAFASAQFDAGNVTVTFQPGTAAGLTTQDGGPIKGFAIAGEKKVFAWADAKILPGVAGSKEAEGTVFLSCPQVAKPVAVRYGWADNPQVNLVNQSGLPAVPFRYEGWSPNQ